MIAKARRSAPGALAALALLGSIGCNQQIPPGTVGIKFNANSGISEKLVKPQVVWIGYGDRVFTFPTSIKNATFVKNAKEGDSLTDDSIRCSTLEGAILPVDVTVTYHVNPSDILTAFTKFGGDDMTVVQHEFLKTVTVYGMNAVSGQHSIFDLISTDRSKFGPQVKQVIAPILEQWGVSVDDIYIGEVWPPDVVSEKVQERVAARNDLEQAKIRLTKARIDAETILTQARQEAETNRLLAQQGKAALDLRRLKLQNEAIQKWDGETPAVGDRTIPFTSIDLR